MDLGLKGRVALVTASSGGMGRNIAETLAGEGADIVLFARSADKIDDLAAALEADHGIQALAVPGSILESGDIARLYDAIRQRFGRLDVGVFSTGRAPTPLRAVLKEDERARWDQSYEILLAGIVELALGAVPLMAENNWGRIVAITSASVDLPMPHHALSTVFRAGIEAYIRHLSGEAGTHGITANCVAPALIDASHREGVAAYSEEQLAERRRMTPLGRLGTQQEICAAIAFLASEQAGFISGESIRVDGGMAASIWPKD